MFEFPKTLNLAIGAMEEVTLAFGPHPTGTPIIYVPMDVNPTQLIVERTVFPKFGPPGHPVVELITIKPVALLTPENPGVFKILAKIAEVEETIQVTVLTPLLTPKKEEVLVK